MKILGLSAFYHDSAACLVIDGDIVAAAQEERFTRKKHDAGFPTLAIDYCLREAGIAASALDSVAFFEKPLLKFDRLLETYLSFWPRGFKLFLMGLPPWLKRKLNLPRQLDRGLRGQYRGRYVFLEHHESHAASAFFPSPFQTAAIVTLDGVGEWTTGSIGRGDGHEIEILEELRFPHSLGLLYSAFTHFTGFKVNSGEYKLMGLAPYGRPIYAASILEELLDLKEDGSFRLNMDYFGYGHRDVMISPKMARRFGGPPRKAEGPITRREVDIAASIQAVTEEIVLRVARHAHQLTGLSHLTMAGGVALNCVANGRLTREGPFDHVWIQPAAGDAGGALGAALFVHHQLAGQPRPDTGLDRQKGSLLGPAYDNDEVRRYLDGVGAVYRYFEDEDQLIDRVAALLADQRVVGHAAGRMEFGPRALGARSILGDPRSPEMQSLMNLKIKFRESFRPFAPAVLRERAHDFFDMRPGEDSPYMMVVVPVAESQRVAAQEIDGGVDVDGESDGGSTDAGLERRRVVRSTLPATTHVDYSARVQTVDRHRHPRFHKIIAAFEKRTGCPVLINTSFNVRGEPIVNTPADSYRCFLGTDMDALVIENFLLLRSEQPQAERFDRTAYRSTFDLD